MTSPLSPEEQRVVGHIADHEGRLHTIPSKRSKRSIVLDHSVYWRIGGTVDA